MITAQEFISNYTDSSFAASTETADMLRMASFRETLYREIHQHLSPDHAPLLRRLLQQEMLSRKENRDEEFFENLYWCAYLLFRLGDVTDVLLLWQAKSTNFDTMCGFDVQFLVGAGVHATVQYLQQSPGTGAKEALEYISNCQRAGDFDDLVSWTQWRDEYFRE